MININSSIDEFYRYKMPKVIIKLKGNGNGKFTELVNIEEISNCINTPSEIIFKYISSILGSSCNYKDKTINGYHNNIQELIFDYIDKFVICPTCKIPELTYFLEKKNLNCKCSACGNIIKIKSINNKIYDKCIDNISKYLIKENKWKKNDGSMVEQKNDESMVEQNNNF